MLIQRLPLPVLRRVSARLFVAMQDASYRAQSGERPERLSLAANRYMRLYNLVQRELTARENPAARYEALLARLAQSAAGRALAAVGARAVHQGGGLVNFERTTPSGATRLVISAEHDGDGWGPERLDEPVLECDPEDPSGQSDRHFPSVIAYALSLALFQS